MERYGRKFAHQFTCAPCLIGWLIIYFSTTLPTLLTGRLLTGFCIGLLGPPTGVYISETSAPKYRGFFLALISFGIAFGVFLSHLAGTFLSWQVTALMCATFPVLAFLTMIGTPESPTYYAKKDREKEAREAFHWCRGHGTEAKEEINIIIQKQKLLQSEAENSNIMKELATLRNPEFVKPLIIIVTFFIVIQWSGLNAMTFYTVTIIQRTVNGNIDEYVAMLIVDTLRLFMSVFACVLLRKIGRRPLAFISGFGTSASLFCLTAYIYFTTIYPEYAMYYPIAVCGILFYVTFITVGFVPLPWIMMGEVFPVKNRGIGSGISALTTYVAFFSVVKTTPGMFSTLGTDGTFLTYGLVALAGTVILYFFLPETKDKALHSIEDGFKENST